MADHDSPALPGPEGSSSRALGAPNGGQVGPASPAPQGSSSHAVGLPNAQGGPSAPFNPMSAAQRLAALKAGHQPGPAAPQAALPSAASPAPQPQLGGPAVTPPQPPAPPPVSPPATPSPQAAAPFNKTPDDVVRGEKLKKWLARGLIYAGIPTLVGLGNAWLNPNSGRVQRDLAVDEKTGLTAQYDQQLKRDYGKLDPKEALAQLNKNSADFQKRQAEQAAAAKANGGQDPRAAAAQARQRAEHSLNQGFAEANIPTGRPDTTPFQNGFGWAFGALAAATTLLRTTSGQKGRGILRPLTGHGLTNQAHGLSSNDRRYNDGQLGKYNADQGAGLRTIRGLGNANVADDWDHNRDVALGQQVPPRLFPTIQDAAGGSRTMLAPESPEAKHFREQAGKPPPLMAREGTTRAEQPENRGVFPDPATYVPYGQEGRTPPAAPSATAAPGGNAPAPPPPRRPAP